MENPWLALTEEALDRREDILEIDREAIDALNARVRKARHRVQVRSLPEPFIGNPDSARVVFLGLNPGHSPQDAIDYGMPEFREALLKNLHHGNQEFPFYPLNPKFEGTGAGKWWRLHTARLRRESGLSDAVFAERVMAIEWFPYHSERGPHLKGPIICPSQEYSFELARNLHEQGKILIMLRSNDVWVSSVKRFLEFQIVQLKNPQRAWLTRGNMPDGFYERVLETLRTN